MFRDCIKAGPIDRTETRHYLVREFWLTVSQAGRLILSADVSATGSASRELPDGRRVWVSALVTLPGKYMIEVD